jgi:FtsJ-like methyltransferase
MRVFSLNNIIYMYIMTDSRYNMGDRDNWRRKRDNKWHRQRDPYNWRIQRDNPDLCTKQRMEYGTREPLVDYDWVRENRNKYWAYSPLTRSYIELTTEQYDKYQKILQDNPNIRPYRYKTANERKDRTEFEDEHLIESYLENKQGYLEKLEYICRTAGRNLEFGIASPIDIYKMKRDGDDIDINNKYLVQQDPRVIRHMIITSKIQDKLDEISDFVFIPYLDEDLTVNNIDIKPHNKFDKVFIANNKDFVSQLRRDGIEGKELGELIAYWNKILHYYNSMIPMLQKYHDDDRIEKGNLIDSIYKYEKERLWGIDKDTLARRLRSRNDILKNYKSSITHTEVCRDNKPFVDNYISELSESNEIVELDHLKKEIQNCNASSIDLDSLIYDEFDEFENADQHCEFCKTMRYAPSDIYSNHINNRACTYIINKIANDIVRDNLSRMAVVEGIKTDCFNVPDANEDLLDSYDVFEQFMPEWHEAIYNGNMEEAYKHRQLLLGDIKKTYNLRNCSLLFRVEPFISRECELPGLVHDIELNKIIVSCVSMSDDVFPIRIENPKILESIYAHEPFKVTDNDKLMGSIVIKLQKRNIERRRRNETMYFNSYLYYNKDKRFKLIPVNYRSNVMIPGTLSEHVRVLYTEMNVLMYLEDDIGIKLHYYKYGTGDNFIILVSKYTMEQIKDKYENLNSFDRTVSMDYLNNLTEVNLVKAHDKTFRFVDMPIETGQSQSGGSKQSVDSKKSDNNEVGYRYDFKCINRNNYEWNIKTGSEPILFDGDVFSVSLYHDQTTLINKFISLADKEFFNLECLPINYLKGFVIPALANDQMKKMRETLKRDMVDKTDSTGKIYNETLSSMKENVTILAYEFESSLSIYFFHLLNRFLQPPKNTKYLCISKNHYLIDGIILYSRLHSQKDVEQNIHLLLYNYNYEPATKVRNYLETNNIETGLIDETMNNDWIQKWDSKLEMTDYSIVDMIIGIDELSPIRYSFMFQSEIPAIILSLKKLNKGGVLAINATLIPNKMIFNFFSFLSCFFDEVFIDDFSESELHTTGQLMHSIVVFKGYTGLDDENMKHLMELNRMMYELDDTGGYRFNTNDTVIKELFNFKSSQKEDVATEYVTNIFDISSPEIDEQYSKYKEYVKMKMLGSIRNFTQRMDKFLNKDDEKKIGELCKNSKALALYLAKKYEFPLVEWANEIPSNYFDLMIEEYFDNLRYSYQGDLSHTQSQITESQSIQCNNCSVLYENDRIFDLNYIYVEKINYDHYAKIEMFLKIQQEKLNQKLNDDHQININGYVVKRDWIKFQELITDCELFESYKNVDNVKAFLIGEAPGGFVHSMKYYVDKHTNIKELDWIAQSLSEDVAEVYDSYGFVEQTKDRWDMSPDGIGDIMDMSTFEYYLKKHKGVDLLISDCSERISRMTPINLNLSIHQMYYALLFPKTGGSFVIKTFVNNSSKLFLSLLLFACNLYENVTIFKSNSDIWEQDIYIVGKNKGTLSNADENILLNCLKGLSKGKTMYPIDNIPDEFIEEYNKIMNIIASITSNVKKFLVFLAINSKIFRQNRRIIVDVIDDKHDGWVNKYIHGKKTKRTI